MSGEKDLQALLRNLSPELVPGEFVFCSFEAGSYGDHAELQPIAAVAEREGLTLVIPRSRADRGALRYESVFRCISLGVHSDLEAVGLTAAVSAGLARHGISANLIAGYFHDHVFVQPERAQQALAALTELAD